MSPGRRRSISSSVRVSAGQSPQRPRGVVRSPIPAARNRIGDEVQGRSLHSDRGGAETIFGTWDKSTPASVSVRQRATARFTPTATKCESSIGDCQLVACRAAVGIVFGLVDEVLLSEAPIRLRAGGQRFRDNWDDTGGLIGHDLRAGEVTAMRKDGQAIRAGHLLCLPCRIRRLVKMLPALDTLYSALSPGQKKAADAVFRQGAGG
jgi:hypothetical protein